MVITRNEAAHYFCFVGLQHREAETVRTHLQDQRQTTTKDTVDSDDVTVVGKLLYCAPAWSGFCSAADCTRLDSILRRCHKLGYTDKHYSDISTMFQEADDALFRTILSNTSHVLHTFVSEWPDIHTHYELDLTINYSFQKLATLAIDTLLLGLFTKTCIDVIITHHTELIC